jgi:hypothetical protein
LFSTVPILMHTIIPKCHFKYNMILLIYMASGFTTSFPRPVINTPTYHFKLSLHFIEETRAYGSVFFLSNPTSDFCVDSLLLSMAPVVRIDPNGIQTLLSFDNARDDLERNSWGVFIEKFEGFNLRVAHEFALTFNSYRTKIGDMQLEVNEDFISQVTSLPAVGQKWFKNAKVEEVPWSLLFTSRKISSCDRGMPVSSLKPRWHAKCLNTLDQGECCDALLSLRSRYWLNIDEGLFLSDLSNNRITCMCPR